MRSNIQQWSIGMSVAVWFLIASFAGGIAFEALAEIQVIPPGFTVMTCVSGIATPNKLTIAPDGSLIIVDYDTTATIGDPDTTPDYIRKSDPPCNPRNPQTPLLTVQRDSDPGVGGVAFSSDGTKMFFTFSTGNGGDRTDGEIRVSSPPGTAPTVPPFKSGLNQPFGLALAPACFGDFAGKLIVADGKGPIYAVDTMTGDAMNITAPETLLKQTDLAFSPDCNLFTVGGSLAVGAGVVRVNQLGTVSLVIPLPYAFALTVHPITGDLYVITRVSTFPPAHEIKKINPTTGEITTFATADGASDLEAGEVGGGGGGLVFSPDGSTLYVSEAGLDQVVKITGPFITTGPIIAHKFHDLNGNGVQDSEPNLSGWAMSLFSSSNCQGSALQSGTTDANGNKTFANLVAGSYSQDFRG